MKKNELEKAMALYGYSLFTSEAKQDFIELLNNMLAANDQRIIEGVPVVIANHLLQDGYDELQEDVSTLINKLLSSQNYLSAKRALLLYFITAFFLEKELGMAKESRKIRNYVAHAIKDRDLQKKWAELVLNNTVLEDVGLSLDLKRLKEVFRQYAIPEREAESPLKKSDARRQISLEYNLSQLFPIKQKELIKKKINGEKFAKTEREYFSRVIKRKISAIVDPDVQDFLIQALK